MGEDAGALAVYGSGVILGVIVTSVGRTAPRLGGLSVLRGRVRPWLPELEATCDAKDSGGAGGRDTVMNRYLLEFREADGHVMSEVLYFYDAGAGPVDPDGLPLSEGRNITMYGREWRIARVEKVRGVIRIVGLSASEDDPAENLASARSGGSAAS